MAMLKRSAWDWAAIRAIDCNALDCTVTRVHQSSILHSPARGEFRYSRQDHTATDFVQQSGKIRLHDLDAAIAKIGCAGAMANSDIMP